MATSLKTKAMLSITKRLMVLMAEDKINCVEYKYLKLSLQRHELEIELKKNCELALLLKDDYNNRT